MLTILNRMCWNSRGWRLPTGTSENGGYLSHYGFGHEEWNFQVEDEVDGYVYGYLYFRPAGEKIKQAQGHFRIGFWSIYPRTKERLLVGIYNDAELTTAKDMKKVDAIFRRKGIYERRAEELYEVSNMLSYEDAYREITNAVKNRLLNFRCAVDKVQPLIEYVPIRNFLKSRKLGLYFSRPTYISSSELPKFPKSRSSISKKIGARKGSLALAEDAYYRESKYKLRQIIPRHNHLSNAFSFWLSANGFSEIIQEKDYVDITFEKKGKSFRAELKICYGVGSTKAIREALGQLLEYNFYPNRVPADNWVIILDQKPNKSDIQYVKLLKTKLQIPLSLGWKEQEDFVFAENLSIV